LVQYLAWFGEFAKVSTLQVAYELSFVKDTVLAPFQPYGLLGCGVSVGYCLMVLYVRNAWWCEPVDVRCFKAPPPPPPLSLSWVCLLSLPFSHNVRRRNHAEGHQSCTLWLFLFRNTRGCKQYTMWLSLCSGMATLCR
jgi:hypothetical protein